MNIVKSSNVTVHGDEFGFYATGITRRISCDNVKFIAQEYFNPSAITTGNCMQVLPEGTVIDNTAGAIKVAKLALPNKGFIWIAFADYNTLITACNACCNA